MFQLKMESNQYLLTSIRVIILIVLVHFCAAERCLSQDKTEEEEISVFLNMPRIGSLEITSVVRSQVIYLPVTDVFNFLKIVNVITSAKDTVSGFFINQPDKYVIDQKNNRIWYQNKSIELNPGDLIKTSENLYLKSDYFGKIFGLYCVFNFRNLSVIMQTALELPVMREMRQSEMRNNISHLKGDIQADTLIKRSYPAFHFGTADWSVISTQDQQLGTNTRLVLGMGGIIAGGETNVSLNYDNKAGMQERNQYYLWRLANNDNPLLKQIMAGKIFGQSIASIYAPIVGVQITNAPTSFRRSFGSYTISNTTQPNWTVELYVNNTLVNYVRADASGYYTFEVPLVYGSSAVKLRFYGPNGEERSSEQNISIPFNFLPKNEFEYTASAGIVEDDSKSKFSRISANYGLTRSITIGGGTEYLSSVTSGTIMPFINSSARLFKNLLLSGEYTYGVRTKGILTYSLPSGLQFELNNTWYANGQTAINNTFSEERRAIISTPFRGKFFSGYSRLTINQMILPVTKYTTAEWLVSAVAWNINASVNTYALFSTLNPAYINSTFSISAMILKSYRFTQQAQYEYSTNRLIGYKELIERRLLKKGYLTLSYEKNIASQIENFELGLRFDLSFAQMGMIARRSNNSTMLLEFANGSLAYDKQTKYLNFKNTPSLGKGGITLIAYLDLNYNNLKDPGEPRAANLKLRSNNGGRIVLNNKDTTLRITDLEPYVNYMVELDTLSFENLSWRLSKHKLSIAIDPNKIKTVELAVHVLGEISGKVKIKIEDKLKGQSRILVGFYDKDKLIGRTVTEPDGYFSYLGLRPGTYTARLDTVQLNKLNLNYSPENVPFTIKKSLEGAVVSGLEFVMNTVPIPTPIKTDTTSIIQADPAIDYVKNNAVPNTNPTPEAVIADSGQNMIRKGITVQAAHFQYKSAQKAQKTLLGQGYKTIILPADYTRHFNIYIIEIKDIETARSIINSIKKIGFPDAFIVP
jgi:hypothetical protein